MWNREALELREDGYLIRVGVRAMRSRGRRAPEAPDPLRTCFQRDRDRILHSTAFRRLQGKTQVLESRVGDHFRTRLTHSLEVSQLARSACLALGLNADLAEAVALAHDLGHPPFGHAGERRLDALMQDQGGFRHNLQGLRIVDELEEAYAHRRGLNLSYETRACLVKGEVPKGFPFPEDLDPGAVPYVEGQIVDLCDRAAYVCHDLDDAIRSGLVPWEAFEHLELSREALALVAERTGAPRPDPGRSERVRRQVASTMVSLLIRDLVLATDVELTARRDLKTPEDVRTRRVRLAKHSAGRSEQLDALLRVLRSEFYRHPEVLGAMERCADRIEELFVRLRDDPSLLPPRFRARIAGDGLERTICDYIAGMTDRYLERALSGGPLR